MVARVYRLRQPLVALGTILAIATVAYAQGMSVDLLVARVISEPDQQPYTLNADFTARLMLNISTGTVPITGAGSLVESRPAPGEARRRRVTLTSLQVPILLRPFSSPIRDALKNMIESEPKAAEFLQNLDVFVVDELPGGRYQVGGVRQDIVTEVMTKYRQTAMLRDVTARRAIAKWLHSPSQRASIVRGGGAYMLSAVVDEAGVVHDLTLFYEWGHIRSQATFITIGGRSFWKDVNSDTSTLVAGMGRVDGHLVLHITNHCLNCSR
ncbi:MAG TPA: hypothetical protein VFM39_05935 [bacterium]|nr:hypothetical protein [bacterium]